MFPCRMGPSSNFLSKELYLLEQNICDNFMDKPSMAPGYICHGVQISDSIPMFISIPITDRSMSKFWITWILTREISIGYYRAGTFYDLIYLIMASEILIIMTKSEMSLVYRMIMNMIIILKKPE